MINKEYRKQWDRMYKQWKRGHPEINKVERVRMTRGCFGKLAFQDFGAGMLALRQIERSYPESATMSLYKCEICECEHMGNHRGQVAHEYAGPDLTKSANNDNMTL